MPLKNPKDKEVIIRDEELEKYLKVVKDCLDANIYEAALILSQTRLEQLIKRIIKYKFRLEGVNATAIDEYLSSNTGNIEKLTDAYFKIAYKNTCHDFIIENLKNTLEKKYFRGIWANFMNSSKALRNLLIHTGSSGSPSSLVFSTKNNIYLMDLIIIGFYEYSKINILGDLKKIKGFKKSKYDSIEKYLLSLSDPQSKKKTPMKNFDFKKLKKDTLEYQKYLKSKNAP
ncbi:MAG: hypothetical protein SFU98_13835 [Leptospiraceae bacterium]|nr:hypothetical protein [Leptospiraceae bacterium]